MDAYYRAGGTIYEGFFPSRQTPARPAVGISHGLASLDHKNGRCEMPTGKIKKWNADRGLGFILPDAGQGDVFFHVSVARRQRDHRGRGGHL
jgi:hypothetical protein